MKRAITFLAALFCQSLVAQSTFNVAFHNKSESAFPFLTEISGNYFFVSVTEQNYLHKYDPNGNHVFSKNIAGMDVSSIITTKDNHLLVTGNFSPVCDFPDPEIHQNILTALDQNGNVVFTSTLALSAGTGLIKNLKATLQYADSTYISFTDSSMHQFSKTGAFNNSKNLGLGSISASLLLQNNNILLSAKQGSAIILAEINAQGTLVAVYQAPQLFTRMILHNANDVIALADNYVLYRMSAPLYQVAASSNFSPAQSISDFDLQNDSIYVVTGGTAFTSYVISNVNFSVLAQSTTTTQRVNQLAVKVKNSKAAILSNCNSDALFSANNPFVSLNVIDKISSNNFTQDIGVVNVKLDSVEVSAITTSIGPVAMHTDYTAKLGKAFITVKNYGTAAISSFNINLYIKHNVSCGVVYYQSAHSGIFLAPNDSITVPIGPITKQFTQGGAVATHTFDFCFYTTIPDGANDKFIGNDGFCYSLPVAVGLKANLADKPLLRAYPNPFNDLINIESGAQIKNIEISNLMGAVLLKEEPNSKAFQINEQIKYSGIYFLKIETTNGSKIIKMIKE
jgi:hypothetical protein